MALALTLTVLCVVALLVGMTVSNIYNRLVKLSNQCDNGFAQIEVQLKRRNDLIPNLVESVRGYMTHESETLEAVIEARNQASAVLSKVAQNPTDGQALQSLLGSEGALASAIGRLNFVMEDYPELKASANVSQLTEELTHTENRVAFARQAYNDLVMIFNTYRQSFPPVAIAGTLGFPNDRAMLEIPHVEEMQDAPQVSLV